MVYFFRHGLDDENYIGGWSDVDLLEKGKQQVRIAIEKMKEKNIKLDKIISSDVVRAITSAEMIRESYQLNNIQIDHTFAEQNKGLMNGMLREQAKVQFPKFVVENVDTVYPEGESLRDLYNRILKDLNFFLNLEKNTLVVTHRGVINMLYYILNNIELDMDKKKFGVTHASLHALDTKKKIIKKVF